MSAAYHDPYQHRPIWAFIDRILTADFRVGRFFGVELRVLWFAVVLFPILSMTSMVGARLDEMLFFAVFYTLAIGLVIYSHEMGHIVAGWRYRIHTPLITLSPLGGLAHMSSAAPTPRIDAIISLAGPAVHLIWLAVFWPLSYAFEYGAFLPSGWRYDPVYVLVDLFFWINVLLLVFNLLPFYPMDGGRVLRAILASRMHHNRAGLIAAKVGMIGAVLIGLYGLFYPGIPGFIMIALGLRSFFACKQAAQEAKYSSGPYAVQREAWQMDPDFWKVAVKQEDAQQAPGFFARRKEQRRQKHAAKNRESQRILDAEVDRVLARLSDVGINELTAAERSILDRASKQRRKTGG